MAIFPPECPNYTDPTFDSVMNYGSGAVLIPVAVLSLFFNVVVFHVNLTQQRMGTATFLFLVLASSDFIYTLVGVPLSPTTWSIHMSSLELQIRNPPYYRG